MKAIFVCSGNSPDKINPIIVNQGGSLSKECDVEIYYFTIQGKGIIGYLKNVILLKQYISTSNFDLIHAHYSLSGIVASLTLSKPLVVSLMGSDVYSHKSLATIIKIASYLFTWDAVIVKSEKMNNILGIKNSYIIPNGVDLNKFMPMDNLECKRTIGWDINRKHLLFASDPEREEKNYCLTEQALRIIDNQNIEIHFLNNISNEITPFWFNASDVVLLSSIWEGSPNVIKEAMACNRPIVCTDVGDVKWLFNGCEGCFISPCDEYSYADEIKKALNYKKSEGRSRIMELGLSSDVIAKRIHKVYQSVIN